MLWAMRRSISRALRPTNAGLLAAALFLLLFATLALLPIQPADFWWHLKVGEIVLEQGRVPRVDLFSYTIPEETPVVYQGWLAGVIFALLYRLGGPAAVVVLNAALITSAYILLWRACRAAGAQPNLATGCTFLAMLVSLGNWGARPQSFSTVLFAVFMVTLVRFRRGQKGPIWLLVPLTALWANLHGAFVLGLALLGTALLGELGRALFPGRPFGLLPARRRLALLGTTVLCLAAPLLNPAGWRIAAYLFKIQGHPVIHQAMAEWRPPRPDDAVGAAFYLSLLGLFFLLLYRRYRPDPVEALWLAGTAWLALGGVRSILWYSFVLGLLTAQGLAPFPLKGAASSADQRVPTPRWQTTLNLGILALLAALTALTLPWFKGVLPLPPDLQGTVSTDTPMLAADYVAQEELEGPIFHRMEYGGYLLWRFYPERRVFIDPRIEIYPLPLWEDYLRISSGTPEAATLLDQYGVEVLLLDTRLQAGLVALAQTSGRWQVRYVNPLEGSVVLVRAQQP